MADRAGAQEVQLAIAAHPETVVGFWRAVLGYTKPLRHAMHVDVSVAREHTEARLVSALAAGGRLVDDSQAPVFWILADRAGNRVCIAVWPDGAATSVPTTPEPSRAETRALRRASCHR